MLEVEHADPDLARMETDLGFTAGFDAGIAKKFRYTMQQIRTVSRWNQLYQYKGFRLKKIAEPSRYRFWLNDKYRLIADYSGEVPNEKVRTIEINNHYGDNG